MARPRYLYWAFALMPEEAIGLPPVSGIERARSRQCKRPSILSSCLFIVNFSLDYVMFSTLSACNASLELGRQQQQTGWATLPGRDGWRLRKVVGDSTPSARRLLLYAGLIRASRDAGGTTPGEHLPVYRLAQGRNFPLRRQHAGSLLSNAAFVRACAGSGGSRVVYQSSCDER